MTLIFIGLIWVKSQENINRLNLINVLLAQGVVNKQQRPQVGNCFRNE
jgi:hypothetical protein